MTKALLFITLPGCDVWMCVLVWSTEARCRDMVESRRADGVVLDAVAKYPSHDQVQLHGRWALFL